MFWGGCSGFQECEQQCNLSLRRNTHDWVDWRLTKVENGSGDKRREGDALSADVVRHGEQRVRARRAESIVVWRAETKQTTRRGGVAVDRAFPFRAMVFRSFGHSDESWAGWRSPLDCEEFGLARHRSYNNFYSFLPSHQPAAVHHPLPSGNRLRTSQALAYKEPLAAAVPAPLVCDPPF